MRIHVALSALLAAACGASTVDEAALRAEIRAEILREMRDESSPRQNADRAPPEPLPEDRQDRSRIGVDGAPRRGAGAPLVTIVTFSDFQCPFCGRAQPVLERLLREYPEEVALVFRHHPLPFHYEAMPAAEAAHEMFAQGGAPLFWRYHDLLFENQRSLRREDLLRYATQIGADALALGRALDARTHRRTIEADVEEANARGARGTPAFFINGVMLMGAQPYERFREVVESELAYARALMEHGVPRAQLYAHLMEDARTDAPEPAPAAAALPTRRERPDPDAIYRVPTADRPQLGPDDALVTIVQFLDFQCPFCARAVPTLAEIRRRYGNDVRIVIRHNPLPFHTNAFPAAEAAMEVHAQLGDAGFFAYHDLLFANQRDLEPATLLRLAREVGASPRRVEAALADRRHRAAVEADSELTRSLGASGTPTFFINGRNVRGSQPFDVFAPVIEEARDRARSLVQSGTPRAAVYERLIRDGHTSPQLIEDTAPARPPPPPPDHVYALAVPSHAPSRGPADAPVTIQIVADFQCPFCARVRPTLEQLLQRRGRRVRLVWRDYPLPFHRQAMLAAEAGREVFAQGGDRAFWEMHDRIFENQRDLSEDLLVRLAGQIRGVDADRVRQALADHRHVDAIRADMQAVQATGATIGTPSTFINGRLIAGAQPIAAFEAAIDRALAEAGAAP